ncbi:hypothetical protein ACFSZS_08050 [Seohaeicola zhoushanensis]
MAGENAIKVGLEAMRLGGVIYIAPFFFVLNPALIGQAPAAEVVVALVSALTGVALISMALQGYVSLLGPLPSGLAGIGLRVLLFFGGLMFAMPHSDKLGGLGYLETAALGLALAALPLGLAYLAGKRAARPA